MQERGINAMEHSLYDSLQLVSPYLSPDKVPPEQLSFIKQVARKLAPIHCAGFECLLGDKATWVDFQQRILARHNEPGLLRDYIFSSGLTFSSDWNQIKNLCEQVQNPLSRLHGTISEFWLEFDLPQPIALEPVPSPSVFISLNPSLSNGKADNSRLAVIIQILNVLLGRPISGRLAARIKRCLEACNDGASIIDIGTMLSRRPEVIRVNVGGINPAHLVSFLNQIGWDGNATPIETTFEQMFTMLDRLSLCLDVGDIVYPQIGLECFLNEQPDKDHRWTELFNELVSKGLCTSAKRDALMSWPGYTYPTQSSFPWPKQLILESLLEEPDRFTVIGRRLSHTKLVFQPDGQIKTKGYFGFGPLWLEPAAVSATEKNGCYNIIDKVDKGSLMSAIEKGMCFLLDNRDAKGWWRDFGSLLGESDEWATGSDEWVTAYTATAIASIPTRLAYQAARQAWTLLCNRRQNSEGWGYNDQLPVDMDSTSWGLRLAGALKKASSKRAQSAQHFLRRHIDAEGGLATFSPEFCPQRPVYSRPSIEGWCRVHTCVTAAAAVEDYGEKPRNYLRNHQAKDGSWAGYWWCDDEYPTTLAAEALATYGREEDKRRIKSAGKWVLNKFNPNGAIFSKAHAGDSAFATACGLRILMLAGNHSGSHDSIIRTVNWLIGRQNKKGYWPRSARLRVPPPYAMKPEKNTREMFVVLDHKRIFTTATVLTALESVRRHLKFS
jgi:hypothetical protein